MSTISPGPNDSQPHYGVFLSDLSYTRGLLTLPDFLLNADAKSLANRLRHDICKLLLVFHVVHIPLGQYIFTPNNLFRRSIEILLRDESITKLIDAEMISITFEGEKRVQAISQFVDDRRRYRWNFGDAINAEVIDSLKRFPLGFEFNNSQAGMFAADHLKERLADCASVFGKSSARLLQAIDLVMRNNDNVFVMEDFVARIPTLATRPDILRTAFRLAHDAYFINPNHLGRQPDGVGSYIFVTYKDNIDFKDQNEPLDSKRPIPILFSPTFVMRYFANWLTPDEFGLLLIRLPELIAKIRGDERWHDFSLFYHQTAVTKLSQAIRLTGLSRPLHEQFARSAPDDFANDMLDHASQWSETLADASKLVKLGGALTFALRSSVVRNVIDNWNQPELREYVKLLKDVVRSVYTASARQPILSA